ncbi:MAG: hypothetical protein ACKPAE_10175, partial [Microcystis panniformis]
TTVYLSTIKISQFTDSGADYGSLYLSYRATEAKPYFTLQTSRICVRFSCCVELEQVAQALGLFA